MKYMQEQCQEILKGAGQYSLFSDPPPHIVCGLSNISNGTKNKSLINRTFMSMLIANGADACILDMMDDELVNACLTAELLMNRQIFADGYLEAFRS
jgi:5-methyltetrahydrofolate corrinoid/iron sulfur protein methyltransferase